MNGRPERDFTGMSAEEILFSKPIRPPKSRRPKLREKQVSVKLTSDEHQNLKEAARIYSVPPSTLARIVLVRGVQAALEQA